MKEKGIAIEKIRHYLDFLWAMTEKEIKARYKHALMGFLWVILNPLLQMIIIGFIFSFFIKIPNYLLFLFTGLLPWQFFSLSLTKATPSFVYERALLQKAKFAKEAIPISVILANFAHLLISLVLLISFLLFTSQFHFLRLLLLIPTLVWLLGFTIGLSLLTSSLNVRFRDVNFFVQSLLILWFYASPILYNLTLIPRKLHLAFALNPLTSIFELFHHATLSEGVINRQLLIINGIISLGIVILGIMIYRKQHHYFVDWL